MPVNAEFGEAATTYVSDLSQSGVFVHTEQVLAIGTPITLRFTVLLEDPVSIVARGRVMRQQVTPAGLGIAFVELTPEMVLRIDDIIANRRPRDLGPPLRRGPGVITDKHREVSGSQPVAAVGRVKLKRRGAAPAPGKDDTKIVRAPTDPSDARFEDSKTLMKLEAVDVEIIDEDALTRTGKPRPGGSK